MLMIDRMTGGRTRLMERIFRKREVAPYQIEKIAWMSIEESKREGLDRNMYTPLSFESSIYRRGISIDTISGGTNY